MHDDLIFLATSRTRQSRVRVDKYLDGYFTIQLMSDSAGPMELFYDDRHWTLEGEWFYPAFPGVHTRFHPANEQAHWFHRHVGFQGPLVSRWQAAGWWLDAPQKPPQGRDYVAFFDEIITLVRRGDEWARLRAINLMEHLLLELAEDRAAQNIKAPDRWLGALLEKLEGNGEMPKYENLAREMGLSLTALRRRFKEATGVPLHTWVLQNRVARARALLAESDLPLKAIATQLGYNNVYFFARQFKQLAGVAPGHYRKSRL